MIIVLKTVVSNKHKYIEKSLERPRWKDRNYVPRKLQTVAENKHEPQVRIGSEKLSNS